MICRSKAQGIFFLLCFFISSLAAGIVEERRVVLSSAVPEFCRAAAFIDGEKLLRSPGMFGLMSELLPGVKSENITVSDLAHAYLFFASEDLKLYGVVIKKGKGDLEKLYRLFKKNSDPLFMCFKNKDLLTAAWGRGTAAVLDLKGKDKVLEKIDFN